MDKLLFLSVLIAMILLPLRASRAKNPMRGMRQAIASIFVFNAFYLVAVLFGYLFMHLQAQPGRPDSVNNALHKLGR